MGRQKRRRGDAFAQEAHRRRIMSCFMSPTDSSCGRMHRPYIVDAKEIGKPNSVPDRDRAAIISLDRSSPIGSCGLPARLAASHRCAPSPEREAARMLGLAPAGGCLAGHVSMPPVSSYLTFSPLPCAGQSVSVALLRASPRPDVIRQRALWSSDFPQADRSPPAIT